MNDVKFWVLSGILLFVTLVGGCMAGYPRYAVWQQGLRGQAELKRAEQNRKVQVEEARARLESAKLLAQAEVERARGVKESNDIIADGLGGAEGYLRYLYINGLSDNAKGGQVIYIPTEAGLPILEARDKR